MRRNIHTPPLFAAATAPDSVEADDTALEEIIPEPPRPGQPLPLREEDLEEQFVRVCFVCCVLWPCAAVGVLNSMTRLHPRDRAGVKEDRK